MAPFSEPYYPIIFFRNQFSATPVKAPAGTNIGSSVAIVTGANSGLGLESSRQLLSLGLCHLVMAVRTPDKAQDVVSKLRAQYAKATIDVWVLDMNSYESIQTFARRVESDLPRIDYVIINAGVYPLKFETVPSTGHEETIQVNYLSTALLTILLLPMVRDKAPQGSAGRITLVSAALSHVARFQNKHADPLLPSFDEPKNFDMRDTYPTSKLLAQMFVYKLVEKVSADDVVVNLVCPGYVKGTALIRDASLPLRLVTFVFSAIFARRLTDGASTYIDAAVLKGKESHGSFLMSWEVTP